MRRNVRDCMVIGLLSRPGARSRRAEGAAGSGPAGDGAGVSGRAALDAGLLLELDLVARADDVVVVGPGAVDRHAASRGMFRTCSRTFQIPRMRLAGEIEIELVHAVDDLGRRSGLPSSASENLLCEVERRTTGGTGQTRAVAARCPLRSARIGPGPSAHRVDEHRRARTPPALRVRPSRDITSIPARTWSTARNERSPVRASQAVGEEPERSETGRATAR